MKRAHNIKDRKKIRPEVNDGESNKVLHKQKCNDGSKNNSPRLRR